MSGILNFSDDIRAEVGLIQGVSPTKPRGWLTGWLSGGTTGTALPRRPSSDSSTELPEVTDGKNFRDLWIEFLLNEAQKDEAANNSATQQMNRANLLSTTPTISLSDFSENLSISTNTTTTTSTTTTTTNGAHGNTNNVATNTAPKV